MSTSDEVDKIIKNQRGSSQLNAHEGSAPLLSVDSALSFEKVERLSYRAATHSEHALRRQPARSRKIAIEQGPQAADRLRMRVHAPVEVFRTFEFAGAPSAGSQSSARSNSSPFDREASTSRTNEGQWFALHR
jgi:hypothetical protein